MEKNEIVAIINKCLILSTPVKQYLYLQNGIPFEAGGADMPKGKGERKGYQERLRKHTSAKEAAPRKGSKRPFIEPELREYPPLTEVTLLTGSGTSGTFFKTFR